MRKKKLCRPLRESTQKSGYYSFLLCPLCSCNNMNFPTMATIEAILSYFILKPWKSMIHNYILVFKGVAFWIAWVFQNSIERTRKVFINNQTVKQLQQIILRVLFSLFWVLMSNYVQNMFWIGHNYVEKIIHLLERHWHHHNSQLIQSC